MVHAQKPLVLGYNTFSEEDGLHKEMMMDTGVYVFDAGEEKQFVFDSKESAFLLMDGDVTFKWKDCEENAKRSSLFDEMPTCLHVSKNTPVTLIAKMRSEVFIQKTTNDREFEPVFYKSYELKEVILGDNVLLNTSRRIIRDIFNYDNAPYSNMVAGEIINLSGRWSSYPPHEHPQPEIYYYRFDKPQGFGASMIGEEFYKITDNSIATIPGGLCHPQVAAPGYAMYYIWMIRHFENNPWTDRIFDEKHKWMLEKDAVLWEPKETN